jgi:hypothetical protein
MKWVSATPRFETDLSVTILDQFQRRPSDRPTGFIAFDRPDKVAYRLGLRGDVHELYSNGKTWIEIDRLARHYFVTPTPRQGYAIFPFESAYTELQFSFPDFLVRPEGLVIQPSDSKADWHPATLTLFERSYQARVRLYPNGAPRTVEAIGLMTWDFGPYRYPAKFEDSRWTTELPTGFSPQQLPLQAEPPRTGQPLMLGTVDNLRTSMPTRLRMSTGEVLLIRVFDPQSDLAKPSTQLQSALKQELAKDKVTVLDLHLSRPTKLAPIQGVGSFLLGSEDAQMLEQIGTPQWWVVSPDGTLYQLFIGIDGRRPLENLREIVVSVRDAAAPPRQR